MYCEKCRAVFEGEVCPTCGQWRYVREVRAEDECFVTETSYLWSGVLADLLRQQGIPFMTRVAQGAGITSQVGVVMARVGFYVMYPRLQDALGVANELFAETDAPDEDADAPDDAAEDAEYDEDDE